MIAILTMCCGVEMSFEKHIFEAILQGSVSHVHIRSNIPPVNENIEYFFDSSETDHARPSFQTKRSIQDFVRRNSPCKPLLKMMHADGKGIGMGNEAFFDVEENRRFNGGFDVKKEGVLMVVTRRNV